MERIEALVNVLGKFAAELGNVKDLISDIQGMVLRQTTDLKEELASFKQSLKDNETPKATHLSETEEELKKRIHKLKIEIGRLEIQKREKEAALQNDKNYNSDQACKNSVRDVSKPTSLADSFADSLKKILAKIELESPIEKANSTAVQILWNPTWMNDIQDYENQSSLPSPTVVAHEAFAESEKNKRENSSAQPVEWWKEISTLKRDGEHIDWKKEYAERKQIRNNLMVKEGWKCKNLSHKELEEIFAIWMGPIKYTVLKRFREKTGKALFNVKFESSEDRQKIYDMRQQIGEEGYLLIGEEYSFIERKERWTMLMMAERLSLEGKITVFDNRKICVDDEWWKYDWVDGWKRV